MRYLGVAGFAALAVASSSCAAVSGLADYSECTDCEDASTVQSTTVDASTTPPEEELSTPVGDDREAPLDPEGDPIDTGADAPQSVPPVDGSSTDAPGPPIDAGTESGAGTPDAGIDAGIGGGPSCGPAAGHGRCNANQVCCANLAAQMNSCAAPASCASNASLGCSNASDCSTATPICCARMSLTSDAMNNLPPKCTATALYASCAASCNDNPPSDATTCKYPPSGTGTVRLCSHDADCNSDSALGLGGGCYNFNGAPVSWCSSATAGLEGTHQP